MLNYSHHAAKVDTVAKAYVYTVFISSLDKQVVSFAPQLLHLLYFLYRRMDTQSQFEGDYSGSCLRWSVCTVVTILTELMWHPFPKTER